MPGLTFTQRDSTVSRQSFVRILLKDTVRMDKLMVQVSAPTLYRRTANLCQLVLHKGKRSRRTWEYQPVSSLELSSAGENTVYLNGLQARELYLVIDNEDNPPLPISELKAYQLNTYLIADLQQGKSYHLEFANRGIST